MKVKYIGHKGEYTAGMKWLERGPYDFNRGMCEVYSADGARMVKDFPKTFVVAADSEVVSEKQSIPGTAEGPHKCPMCEKTYKHPGSLERHMRKNHSGVTE